MHRWTCLILAFCLASAGLQGQQIHRQDLGDPQLHLLKGPANARFEERDHRTTTEYAHRGATSETLTITAEAAAGANDPFIHYIYPTPRAPISDDLRASVWVKSKRPGIRLRARLVLPQMPNPQRPEEALTVLLDGETHKDIDNWQRLEFSALPKLVREKQTQLGLQFGKEIILDEAFIDQIVLNVYAGPGTNTLWIDEISIGPVLEDKSAATKNRSVGVTAALRSGVVELNRDQLTVDGRRFLIRGIRATDTPLEVLKRVGFNTVFLEPGVSRKTIDDAVNNDFYLVPALRIANVDALDAATPVSLNSEAGQDNLSRYLQRERVLFWYLGGGRSAEQYDKVMKTASLVREFDAQRPLGVDAWDGMFPYSRNIDIVGTHRWPLMTSLELTGYRDWLMQRRNLARPGTFTWTWVQTHQPDWYTQLVYNRSSNTAAAEPIGPQPEQIRLLTYIALASGCRGIGYWSDRYLADSHQGQDRLLELARLNLEMQLIENVLLSTIKAPFWIDTSNPQVKAAVLQGERTILVIPIWLGGGAQHVPGQSAQNGLTMQVPMVPDTAEPWEVTPAEVRALRQRKTPGGTEVTVPEFDLTSIIVFTSDNSANGPLVYWQDQTSKMAANAAQWTYDQARAELAKVLKVHAEIERFARVSGSKDLINDCTRRLQQSRVYYANKDYRQSYFEAQRSLRPLRRLMRLEWEQATAGLNTPAASPYAVSYYSLPLHGQFREEIKRTSPSPNALAGGNFEEHSLAAWPVRKASLDAVEMQARFGANQPAEGRSYLELNIAPKQDGGQTGKVPGALERTFLSVTSPAVRLHPGTLVRISGWMRIPRDVLASADGALLYDNSGGEPLAVRQTAACGWKKFELFRRVPSTGELTLTMALTGLGTVQFDDLRIEPMLPK
jgi:hypothetical protein